MLPYHLKFPHKIILITVILDWVWQYLSIIVFPESKFNVYQCNLRWHHIRLQTLKRCYVGIINFPTSNIWEIDLLGTCYIHANFQTCRTCRTERLEVPIPIFFALLLQTTSKFSAETNINNFPFWLNLKIREFEI